MFSVGVPCQKKRFLILKWKKQNLNPNKMKWWQKFLHTTLAFMCSVFLRLISPIFRHIYESKKHPLRTVQSPLLTKSAVFLANMIRKRQVRLSKPKGTLFSCFKIANYRYLCCIGSCCNKLFFYVFV